MIELPEHDGELVPPEPRGGVVVSDALAQALGDVLEQRVAGLVTE